MDLRQSAEEERCGKGLQAALAQRRRSNRCSRPQAELDESAADELRSGRVAEW